MCVKSKLLNGSGTVWENHTCDFVCASDENLEQLMACWFSKEASLSHKATLIILKTSKRKPNWLNLQIPRMVDYLEESLPDWQKRNILRVLQDQNIPESHWGIAADQCFKYLESAKSPVAVKVFSMTVLYRLTKVVPELARELRVLIEDQYALGSPGFRARGRRVLDHLTKDGH